ncbi:MAG: glycine--tRNA ligase subunit beta, partial [Pseudomonadota bacterium]
MPDLLIELFSEEIPARMQRRASEDLRDRVTGGLREAGLTFGEAHAYATPRRLALAVEGVDAQSPTVVEERKGPRADAPEKAIEGFLRGAGVAREDLQLRDEKKGQVYFAKITKPGRSADVIVAEVLESVVRNFPWPKSMRWGAGSLRWVRPLQSILCILTEGDAARVVALDIDGIAAGDMTEGHRFMAPGHFAVGSYSEYEAGLLERKVVLNPKERAEAIETAAESLAQSAGLEVVPDAGLLAEVSGLVEWPVPLMGEIDEAFLGLPPEVLQSSMREHQKFFSLRNPEAGQIERFVTVANVETADDGAMILAGNQKVLAARLSDAKFFWENDLRVARDGMGAWLEKLENVTFERTLGSQAARVARMETLAREIAPVVRADPELAGEAARVAKADLSSEMVNEFPELQGVMGRYYAAAAGMSEDVAFACEEHYSPLGPSDEVPTRLVSVAVALADKLDTLTGFWAIDQRPTGSKDPFALRRAALGVIRLVLENSVRCSLTVVAGAHLCRFAVTPPDMAIDDLLGFFHDRLKVYLRDQGLSHDVIDACLALEGDDDLALVVARARALQAVLATDDGENLVQGFKRANNILTQAEEKDGVEYSYGADIKFAEALEERTLFEALDRGEIEISKAVLAEDFEAAMSAMAALRGPIDAFFEAVQINSENDILRRNRLNMLSRIRQICRQAA